MEIAGKIVELDISADAYIDNPPAVTRFDELPAITQSALTVIAKGVRNITGISYQRIDNQYIKYVANVGQDLAESVFWFNQYRPLPVIELVQAYNSNLVPDGEGFINLGWRAWEGALCTSLVSNCPDNGQLQELTIAYYDEAVKTSSMKLTPLTCYYHIDLRPDKFAGTAITGVQAYMGNEITGLYGGVVFTDFVSKRRTDEAVAKGVLAYSRLSPYCTISDFHIIETGYDFGNQASFYTCLGANREQTKLYLGVYGSTRVADLNLGTVFEIIPW